MTTATKARRNARGRLLRYLLRGGRLVRDESNHYCRATRPGEPYDGQLVERLRERGCVVGGQPYRLTEEHNPQVFWLAAVE